VPCLFGIQRLSALLLIARMGGWWGWGQREMPHPGAGAMTLDHGFTELFLQRLHAVYEMLPSAAVDRDGSRDRTYGQTCASRSFYCDGEGWVQGAIEAAVDAAMGGRGGRCATAGEVNHSLERDAVNRPPIRVVNHALAQCAVQCSAV
jgi:hypothetical protein